MGILEQYKKALEEEKQTQNMDFPTDSSLAEGDREAYETALKKMRKAEFSQEEVEEAIKNSRKNMTILGENHNGGDNEKMMQIQPPTKISDEELMEKGLLVNGAITDVQVIRAYCPECGRELVAKAPPMYNPFTMEKMCLHECCGTKFNLDKTYPHIAFIGKDGEEIIVYGN